MTYTDPTLLPAPDARMVRAVATLSGLADQVLDVLRGFVAEQRRIGADRSLSDEGKATKAEALRVSTAARLATLRSTASEAIRTFEATAADLRMLRPTGTTEEQLLAEMREGRAWDRIRPLLERDPTGVPHLVVDLLDQAVGNRDETTIAVLHAELPAWLAANGLDTLTDTLTEQVDRAVGRLRPAVAAVAPLEAYWTKGTTSVELTLAGAASFVESNGRGQRPVLCWWPNERGVCKADALTEAA